MKNKKVVSKSLLRYPGGKTRAIAAITPFFPKDITELCSPFFGGGSIELYMAANGVRVYAYDIFRPLVDFWQSVILHPDTLSYEVQKYHPITKEAFYKLQEEQNKLTTKLERAAAFYVLNRSSFSGSTLSGGMSPDHPRFNQTSIDRVRDFHNPNFSVDRLDFKESITKHDKIFKYLDPPYLIEGALYGKDGDTHKGFDHQGLFCVLSKTNNWIMSYNNCEEIKNLYKDYEMVEPVWKYGMSKNKESKEVLIFSQDYVINRSSCANACLFPITD